MRTVSDLNNATGSLSYDDGLRAYMIRVYNTMFAGVAATGLASWAVSSAAGNGGTIGAAANAALTGPLSWFFLLSPLAIVLVMSFGASRFSAAALKSMFYIYALLMGVSITPVLMVYTDASVARTFFLAAATFGAISLYGYTTRRDLTAVGSFLIMGLVGLILAGIVNIFTQSTMLDFVLSVIGVLVFAGLTAYDTQKIKEVYSEAHGREEIGKIVTMGALNLYLDFVNLFLALLRLGGSRD